MKVTFHDYHSTTPDFYKTVVDGLSKEKKTIPPIFFYDEKGSVLFDQICDQPEYYLPRVENQMLQELASEIAQLTGKGRLFIEPGAGSLVKVRLLLDALQPSAFVPMDISFDHLKSSTTKLAEDYPSLAIHAACVDFSHSLPIPEEAPDKPRLMFFPGSSLGNFHREDAAEFLRMARDAVGDNGMLLIGVDTKKEEQLLNAAYNDAAGVTEQFNLNLLSRIQQDLDSDIDPSSFEHQAFYNKEIGRIEMHLASKEQQIVRINGDDFEFQPGETIHTENSYKYSPEEFIAMASDCGFGDVRHWRDEDGMFAIYLLRAV